MTVGVSIDMLEHRMGRIVLRWRELRARRAGSSKRGASERGGGEQVTHGIHLPRK